MISITGHWIICHYSARMASGTDHNNWIAKVTYLLIHRKLQEDRKQDDVDPEVNIIWTGSKH